MASSGDQCPKRCGGHFHVAGTRIDGQDRVRYLECTGCGMRTTQMLPLEQAPRQDGVGRPRATAGAR